MIANGAMSLFAKSEHIQDWFSLPVVSACGCIAFGTRMGLFLHNRHKTETYQKEKMENFHKKGKFIVDKTD